METNEHFSVVYIEMQKMVHGVNQLKLLPLLVMILGKRIN